MGRRGRGRREQLNEDDEADVHAEGDQKNEAGSYPSRSRQPRHLSISTGSSKHGLGSVLKNNKQTFDSILEGGFCCKSFHLFLIPLPHGLSEAPS